MKTHYMDKNYVPRIGDEVEWGTGYAGNPPGQRTNKNCGRHKYVNLVNGIMIFEHVSGAKNNQSSSSVHLSTISTHSCFEWFPKEKKRIIII